MKSTITRLHSVCFQCSDVYVSTDTKTKVHLRIWSLLLAFFLCLLQAVSAQNPRVFNSSGTFTIPPGVTSITVECWGGGGAGGGATGTVSGGGGGAGGAYVKKVISVNPGDLHAVFVADVVSGTFSNGGNGEPSWFSNVSTVYAEGGLGGSAATSNNFSAMGAIASSAASIGDIGYIFKGGDGGTGSGGASAGGGGSGASTFSDGFSGGATTGGFGGDGGPGGDGGSTGASGSIGLPGDFTGGGGGGGRAGTATDRRGGDGGPGLVVISWVCPTASISYASTPFCTSETVQSVSLSGPGAGTYSASVGLTLDTNTGDIDPATSTPGNYTIIYTYSGGCETSTNVTVNVTPVCSITGNNGPVCPSTSFSYTAPAGMAAYAWSIAGNGSISSGADAQTVTINSGVNCNASFTLTLVVTHANGCTSTCEKEVNVLDNTAPAVSGSIPVSTVEGCTAADAPAAVTTVAALEALGLNISDACTIDADMTVSSSDAASGTCPVVVTRTYTIKDACLNSTTYQQVINVLDDTAPAISGSIALSTVEGCTAADAPAAVTTVAALEALGLNISDACTSDANLTVTSSDAASGTCPVVVTRTYTIKDACLNSNTYQQIINVLDDTDPAISGSIALSTVEGCTAADAPTAVTTVAALELLGLSISDACTPDASLTVSSSDVASGTCPVVITRTYTVKDACLNSSTYQQIIHVLDGIAPSISGSIAVSTVEGCTDADAPAAVSTVAALEALGLNINDCLADGNLTVTSSDAASGTCPVVVTRTYTIKDACLNSSTYQQVINVLDDTDPVVTGSIAVSTVEGCTAADAPAAVNSVAALETLGLNISDACTSDANLTVTSSDAASGTCPVVVTRTYTIKDACLNSSTYQQIINVMDDTDPAISGSIAVSTVEGCTAADAPAAVTTVAALEALGLTISDACTSDANLTVTSSDAASGTCPVVVTRTYTIKDACLNSSTYQQVINVLDDTDPAISGSIALSTVEGCTAADAPAAVTTVAALEALGLNISDACTSDANLTVTSSDVASGTCPVVITRTYTVKDACLNSSTYQQIIHVLDGIAPSISGSIAVSTVEGCTAADAPAAVTTVAALEALGLTISDCLADGNLTVTNSDAASGTCPVVVTRTYTIKDACLNSSTYQQVINVLDDTDPAISGSIALSTVEGCTAADAPAAVTTVAALEALGLNISDACTSDANLTVTSSDAASGTCPVVVTRTYTIKDACLNSSTYQQVINVLDDTDPAISGSIALSTVEGCTAADAPAAVTTVPALEALGLNISDACTSDANLTLTSSDVASGTCPVVITRTYTVTDACLNSSTYQQTIHVLDGIAPSISGSIAPSTVEGCTAADAPAAVTTVAALEALGLNISDCLADASLTVTSSDAASGTCPVVVTRTYTIKDACMNSSTYQQVINVMDDTDPAISGSIALSTVEGCTAADAPAAVTTVAALEALGLDISDACTSDANLTVSSSDAASGTCPVVVTRTYTIKDACLNSSTYQQVINVDDTTIPVITLLGSPSVSLCQNSVYTDVGATAADNCSGNITVSIAVNNPVNTAVAGTYVVTYNVVDACSNAAVQVVRTVVVHPLPAVAPIDGSNFVYVNSTTLLSDATPAPLGGSAVWSSGTPAVATINQSGLVFGVSMGSSIISYTVTDANSCVNTATFVVNVSTPVINIGVYNQVAASPVGNKLQIRLKPIIQVINGQYSNGVFTLRTATSNGVTGMAIFGSNPYNYTLTSTQLNNGGFDYYVFSFDNSNVVNWAAMTEVPILNLVYSCTGNALFEIDKNYTYSGMTFVDGSFYQELNAGPAQNQISPATATSPATLTPLPTLVHQTCNALGAIDLSVSGGSPVYTYDWSDDGPDMPDDDSQDLNNLLAGVYTVTVTDANGCSAANTSTILYLPVTNISDIPPTHYATIQAAVDAADPNETIEICTGTFNEAVTVNKAGLTLRGAGVDMTIVDHTGTAPASNAGLHVIANNVKVEKLTVTGNPLASTPRYGLKVGTNTVTTDNVVLENIKVHNSFRTGFDIARAKDLSMTDITSVNNGGAGIFMSNTEGALLQNITTANNPWTGVSVATRNDWSGVSSGVVFAGTNSFGESAGKNGGLQLEMTPAKPISWSNDPLDGKNVTILPADFGFALSGPSDDPQYAPYVRFYQTLSQAHTAADGVGPAQPDHILPNNRYIRDADNSSGEPGTNFYVYDNPDNTMTIQAAVNAAVAANQINVFAGTFNEDVNVTKQLTLQGAGMTQTTVIGVIGGISATINIGASGVVVDGFKITREGNNTTDWNNAGLNLVGLAVQGQSNDAEVRNCHFEGNRTGIDINNSNDNFIHNNLIDNNRTGMLFRNQTDNTVVTNNFITNNWTVGVLFIDASGGTNSPVQTAANSSFNNNDIHNNWYGQIVDRQSGGSLPAPGANLKNFECNWYGTTAPAVSTANSAEPGYAAQIPVAYGGSAVAPGGQPDILGPASANFDYVSWLTDGSDTQPANGFQPMPGECSGTPVVITSTVLDHVICSETTGSITVSFSGGTQPYSVNWTGAGAPVTGLTGSPYLIGSLAPGAYTITVTDVNGATGTASASVLYLPVTNTTGPTYYATIQAAVSAASNGDVIEVCAGTYAETILIDKALSLKGPKVGMDANTRLAAFMGWPTDPKANPASEAIITAPSNNPLGGNPGAIDLIRVTANNVSIDGFVLDGNNPMLGSSSVTDGGSVQIHGRRGITNIDNSNGFNPVSNLTVQYNIVQNVSQRGISLANNGPVSTGNTIAHNVIRHYGYDPVNGGQAVILFTNAYADVTDNTIEVSASNIGLHLQNFSANGSMNWASNNITAGAGSIAIHANLFYGTNATLNISGNNVNAATGVTSASDTWGINVWSVQVGSTVQVSGNTVGASGGQFSRGVNLWNLPTANTVAVSGGYIGNSDVGVYVSNYDASFGNATSSAVSLGGLSLNSANTGVYIFDDPSNSNNATVAVSFGANNSISGGVDGLVVENPGASVTGGTLSNLAFSGQSGNYIELSDNAGNLNATAATFAGNTGATATLAQNFAIEDKILHKIDHGVLGFVLVKADHDFVTVNSFIAPATTVASTQRGVDAASAGFTVNINSGTYTNALNINKELKVYGVNSGISPVTGIRLAEATLATTSGTMVNVTTTAPVEIKGLRLANSGGSFDYSVSGVVGTSILMEKNFFDNSIGVYIPNAVSTTIADNLCTFSAGADEGFALFGNYNGSTGTHIDVHDNKWLNGQMTGMNLSSCEGSVYNNVFDNIAYYGILAANQSDLDIYQNVFTGIDNPDVLVTTWGAGVRFYDDAPGASVLVHNNTFDGNYIGISVRPAYDFSGNTANVYDNSITNSTVANIRHEGSGTLPAECNWFGATSLGAISATIVGTVDFNPWRVNGMDNDLVLPGFQPASTCTGTPVVITVDVISPETCSGGTANGAVTTITSNGGGGYTYSWSNATTNSSATGLIGGTYTVVVTDAYGSTASATAVVPALLVTNTTTNANYATVQAAINAALPGETIQICAATFNERVTIDKSLTLEGKTAAKNLYVLDGSGLPGTGDGVHINDNVTNVTIRNLTIQDYTGNSGNEDAAIYANAGNNMLIINNVALLNNPSASGFYANGPVSNVSVTNSVVSNNGGGARGIVIWNGFKQNITFTGNTVSNNSCCGIELQDGTASNVVVSSNTIDIGSGDNAIGLLGLNNSVGNNLIQGNVITGGGRFGIEIKNPDGGVSVSGNTVTLTTQNSDQRDRAGIAVFRRDFTAGNPQGYADVPNGVSISGNIVSGYTQSSVEEGFGIVVEGVSHGITNNTVSGCDVGIQIQGGGHPNANYVMNNAGSGNQDVGASANYFGRGNAPYVCDISESGNILSNTIDRRMVTSEGVFTDPAGTSTIANQIAREVTLDNGVTQRVYCTIQAAVNASVGNGTETVKIASAATPTRYNEQVLVNKDLTLLGIGVTKPVVDFTGNPTGKPTLFDVSANGVAIDGIQFNTNLTKLSSAIIASAATIDDIAVKNNMIAPYQSTPGTYLSYTGSYTDRNAISINYGGTINYRAASGGVNSILVDNNMVSAAVNGAILGDDSGDIGFRAAVAVDEGAGSYIRNTFQTISHDVIVRFNSNGPITIGGSAPNANTFNGGGVTVAEHNAGGGDVDISFNTFNGAVTGSVLRLQNNQQNKSTHVHDNTFTNLRWGISLENYPDVMIEDNTFTPLAGYTNFRHITVNTKSLSSNSALITQTAINGVIKDNVFNSLTPTVAGTALAFYNHDSDNAMLLANAFTVGAAGEENTFQKDFSHAIYLGDQTGATFPAPVAFPEYALGVNSNTTMACWDLPIDIEKNRFDVGAGLQLPQSMSGAQLTALENILYHEHDNPCLGELTFFRPVVLNARVYLQGPYDATTPLPHLMIDELRKISVAPLFPTADPYVQFTPDIAPYWDAFVHVNHTTNEVITNPLSVLDDHDENSIVDWVFLELRSKNNNMQVVATRSALLQRDGDIVDLDGTSEVTFPNSYIDQYYLMVRHRNHLGALTANLIDFTNPATFVDFSDPAMPTYGTTSVSARKLLEPGIYGLIAGNTNMKVNTNAFFQVIYNNAGNDRVPILNKVGSSTPLNVVPGYYLEDVNLNGSVKYSGSNNDRVIILNNVGPSTPLNVVTQEPSN
ncbi:MAG: right-handed parallel beta-helix repeat-containing protein [Saprospiraceae bacterium]|nr:right-handed parallel beta-helix repeat-containing protein [Saprospiraceae bacterium]